MENLMSSITEVLPFLIDDLSISREVTWKIVMIGVTILQWNPEV